MLKAKSWAAVSLAAAMLLAALGTPVQARVNGDTLHLRVGPEINATITTATMHLSCSDNADCRFDVPSNSTFDVVAQSLRGRKFRWTGCSLLPEPNRCRVQVREETVLVTVR